MEVGRQGIDGVGDYDDDDDDDSYYHDDDDDDHDNVNTNGHVLQHVQVEFHKTLLPFRLAELMVRDTEFNVPTIGDLPEVLP